MYSLLTILCTERPSGVSISPASVSLRPGHQLLLECTAQGLEPIRYEWSKADGILSPWATTDAGFLGISSLTASDAGQYLCRAINRAGYTDAYADVNVLGKFMLLHSVLYGL